MARTFIRQDTQIRNSTGSYASNITPSLSNYETTATTILDDLNNIRSQIQNFINRDGVAFPSGDWYDDLAAPTGIDTYLGVPRGINKLNTELHGLERKRVLTQFASLADVLVSGSQNWAVLGPGELPSPGIANPFAVAVGISSVVTGTVAASGSIGSWSIELVSGSTVISPKNLCTIVTGSNRDPLLSSGKTVYALFQTDKLDGQLLVGGDAQLSFVRVTDTGDGLEAVPTADIQNKVINYVSVTRKALEDLSEQDFLRGAEIDVPSAQSGVNRQNVYDNQGTTTVTSNFDATLDLAATKFWEIGDAASATLFKVTDGNATTNTVLIDTAVNSFDVNAQDVDFDSGIKVDTGGTDIHFGVNAGVIETTGADDLRILGAGELLLDDGNQAGSTWTATNGIKLSDASSDWDLFKEAYGEVSLLSGSAQAKRRNKVYATITPDAPIPPDTDIVSPTNIDTPLPQMASGSFLYDYDVYLNGELMRPGATSGDNHDYYPGLAGDQSLRFEFQLRKGDVICVVPYAR